MIFSTTEIQAQGKTSLISGPMSCWNKAQGRSQARVLYKKVSNRLGCRVKGYEIRFEPNDQKVTYQLRTIADQIFNGQSTRFKKSVSTSKTE